MPRPAPFVTIAVSEEQRRELEEVLSPKQVRSALFQAVKRTTRTGATQINRRIREEINISKKYADRAIVAREPKGEEPVGVITISHKMIPLIAFRPRVSKRGVRVTVTKNMPPIFLRHAFKTVVRSAKQAQRGFEGHEGIFLRARGRAKGGGKLTKRGFAPRLPIEEQFGRSVLNVLGFEGTTRVAREELAKLQDTLSKNLQSQVDRFLKPRSVVAATP